MDVGSTAQEGEVVKKQERSLGRVTYQHASNGQHFFDERAPFSDDVSDQRLRDGDLTIRVQGAMTNVRNFSSDHRIIFMIVTR